MWKMRRAASYEHPPSIQAILAPHCIEGRCHIAGSIRRGAIRPKDIEIVAQPETTKGGLFGNIETRSQAFVMALSNAGEILKGDPHAGRYCQILTSEGHTLDLFMPQPHDYWRQMAIRTGPAQYAARVIAGGWRQRGWVGTPDGLRKWDECEQFQSGWRCTTPNPTKPPVWQNENEFFQWLGLKWVRPEARR